MRDLPTHMFGARSACSRASLVVSAHSASSQPSNNSQLLALTLQDFGSVPPHGSNSILLFNPTADQLQQAIQNMQASCSISPSIEDISFYFEGQGIDWRDGWKQLQLLEVQADHPTAAAAGSDADRQLVSPLIDLELHCQIQQCPVLIHLNTCSSKDKSNTSSSSSSSNSSGPTQEQLQRYATQQHQLRSFSHRVTAMDSQNSEQLSLWFWYLYKHTFLVWHASWQEGHDAATAELRAAGMWDHPTPNFSSDESNTTLFPHGYVPEQHHRVLKLMHDITQAASTAPRSSRTAGMLSQLAALLEDAAWRPFVLRWSILLLAAASAPLPATPLDQFMAEVAAVFLAELKLPLALLLLAVNGSLAVQEASAAVLQRLGFRLTEYGRLPNEVLGKLDEEERVLLGQQLLTSEQELWRLPFVDGFLRLVGLGEELDSKSAAAAAAAAAAAGGAGGAACGGGGGSNNSYVVPAAKRQRLDEDQQQLEGSKLQMPPPPAAAAAQAAAGTLAVGGCNNFTTVALGMNFPSAVATTAAAPAAAAIGGGGDASADAAASSTFSQMHMVLDASHHVPANTITLKIRDMQSAAPLLHLHNLQSILLFECTTPAAELMRLSSLHSLREVALCFNKPGPVAAAAPAWPSLPIRSLTLTSRSSSRYGKKASAAVMQHLPQLTGLTFFSMDGPLQHTPHRQFAAALQQLSNLQHLRLSSVKLADEGSGGGSAAAGQQQLSVMSAVANLPQLKTLHLFGLWAQPELHDLALLGSATQLTKLRVFWCRADDQVVAQWAGLTGLKFLGIESCSGRGLSNACMPVLAGLTQLTHLSVGNEKETAAQITDAGATHLTALRQLAELQVRSGTMVSKGLVDRILRNAVAQRG